MAVRTKTTGGGDASAIRRLGKLMGIHPSYISGGGERVRASVDATRAVLGAMGVDVGDPAAALRERIARATSRLMPRTIVAWTYGASVRIGWSRTIANEPAAPAARRGVSASS